MGQRLDRLPAVGPSIRAFRLPARLNDLRFVLNDHRMPDLGVPFSFPECRR